MKSNDKLFKKFKNQLKELEYRKRKIYINNILSIFCENIVINPKAWDKLEEYKKEAFGTLIYGVADLFSMMMDKSFNMLEAQSYDLFEL